MHRKHLPLNSIDLSVRRYIHRVVEGKKLTIATMHAKEKFISPIIEKFLPVRITACHNLDTDQFGTFSGEMERTSPLQALRQKSRLASIISGCPMVIASEGSFGSHPLYSFLRVNEEFVMLTDYELGWEIIGYHITSDTNFDFLVVNQWDDLYRFAVKAGFSSHGIILKSGRGQIYKDLQCWDTLYKKFKSLITSNDRIEAFTDMRAMRNPTRGRSIEQATGNLIYGIFSLCPECMMPGFSIDHSIGGLPCKSCKTPTKITKGFIVKCRTCSYSSYQQDVSNEFTDPGFCDQCNP